jgi:hypothetical protein
LGSVVGFAKARLAAQRLSRELTMVLVGLFIRNVFIMGENG